MKNSLHLRLLPAALLLFPLATSAADPKSTGDAKPAPAATHTIAKGALKPKVQLDAVFESLDLTPVKIETKAWTDLTVLEAVAHGAKVRKGDSLVKLDLEKITEQIKEQEQDAPAARITLDTTVAELTNLEETTPLRLDAAKRAHRIASEELAHWEKNGRDQREKNSKFNLKSAHQRMEGALEELKQLEKMYKADDLTEETEEIILKRQKFAVEAAELSLESSKLYHDRDFKTLIPRENETIRTTKKDQDHALALSEVTLPKALAKKRLDLDKLKRDQKKADKKFADLKKDLELMSITAPADGIVYHGACENGKWTTGATVTKSLQPNGKLVNNQVFITIVNPQKMQLRATATEADLANLKSGAKGTAAPVSSPDKKLPCKLEELGFLPLPGGGFEARISFEKDSDLRLMPGMNAKVSLGDSGRGEVLLAPKDAVFGDDKKHHVWLAQKDAKPEKRSVKVGDHDGKSIEILDGLAEGDKILLTKPE